MIAQRLAIAAIVATWSVPTLVAAQHAKAEPTAAHATPPAKEPAKEPGAEHAPSPAKKEGAAEAPSKSPANEASKDAGKGAAKPKSEHAAAPKNELEAALRRIDEQLASIRTSPPAAQSGKPRVANDARAVRVVPAPSTARVHLSWRTALVWAPDLDGEADAAHDAPHVELVWPASEPLKSTPFTAGSVH